MPTDNGDPSPDEHYQPWLRNQPVPGQPKQGIANPANGPPVARPEPLPTRAKGGKRAPEGEPQPVSAPPPRPARYLSADELLARPITLPELDNSSGPTLGEKASTAARKAGAWTNQQIARADLANRVAKLELRRRTGKATAAGKKAGTAAAQASGTALRSAARSVSAATARARAVASPKLKHAAITLRASVASAATSAAVAITTGTRNAGAAVRAAGRKLAQSTPAAALIPDKAPPPASQLERLLADDGAAQAKAAQAKAETPGSALPLFTASGPTHSQSSAPAPLAQTTPDMTSGAAAMAAPATAPRSAQPQPQPQVSNAGKGGGTISPALSNARAFSSRIGTSGGSERAESKETRPAFWFNRNESWSSWLRHPASWVACGGALILSGFVGGIIWDGGSNRAVTERIVHDYILNHPEIIPQAMEKLQANRIAQTIERQRGQIERAFSGAWAGAADGDVTMVVFTDYACTFCRASVADIDRLLREDRRLKVVFRELPILSADSEAAARLALSAAQSGRYMAVHRALFASGNPDAGARASAALRFDVSTEPARMASPAITNELRSNIQLARDLGFDGTPSWVIGNRTLTGAVGYQALRDAIAQARRQAQ